MNSPAFLSGPTQDDRLWAGLSYAGAVCCFCGLPALLIFFLKRGESEFIRYHALQAFIFSLGWLALFILGLVLTVLSRIDFPVGFFLLLCPGIAWIYLMLQAFMGKDRRIPWLRERLAPFIAED